jgi:hypothetical protein
MDVDPKIKSLLESFIELCDSIVEDSYVVTNGIRVAGIVLDEKLAKHILRKTVTAYKPEEIELAKKEWVVCSIPKALEYAFTRGFKEGHNKAVEQFERDVLNNPSCKEVSDEKLVQEQKEKNDDEGENS